MGDFQFIDIILFGMIAAFLVLRLRKVLGRHKDHGRPQDDPYQRDQTIYEDKTKQDNVIQLSDKSDDKSLDDSDIDAEPPTPPTPLEAGFAAIQSADPAFDGEEFLVGARTAFEMVIQAFAEGDQDFLRGILSNEVFENFAQAIRSREDNNETLENTLIRIVSTDPLEANMEDGASVITVKIITEQVNATRDAEGEVVNGDPNHISEITDIWTFSRQVNSRDPNWRLIATRSLD